MALRSGDTEPSVCMCHPCDHPLEEGDHSQCHNLLEFIPCPEHRDEERHKMVAVETKRAAHHRRLNAALHEFEKIPKNTPESANAWEEVLRILSSNF